MFSSVSEALPCFCSKYPSSYVCTGIGALALSPNSHGWVNDNSCQACPGLCLWIQIQVLSLFCFVALDYVNQYYLFSISFSVKERTLSLQVCQKIKWSWEALAECLAQVDDEMHVFWPFPWFHISDSEFWPPTGMLVECPRGWPPASWEFCPWRAQKVCLLVHTIP